MDYEFPTEDDVIMEHNFNQADLWLEQLEFIGSLMFEPDLPKDWELIVTEPDSEFMEQSDDCAKGLLQELGKL